MIVKRTADLPLHYGRCPPWLFTRMVRLAKAIFTILLEEFDKKEILRRLSDPFWFQALGCLLGFDWHSSGLTTTVGGAIKLALNQMAQDAKLFICGGKGKSALATPEEIEKFADLFGISARASFLTTVSRLVAKIDNNALQDGFQLYFHLFIFTDEGSWAVVQQGMDEKLGYARRYHWFSERLTDFCLDPHSGILSEIHKQEVLNLVSSESQGVQWAILSLLQEPLAKILREVKVIDKLHLSREHAIDLASHSQEVLRKIWLKTYENPPKDFKNLLLIKGLGAKSLRALTLTAELIYEVKASRKDPVLYAYAHGGKDGYPYHVNKKIYDQTIAELEDIISKIRWGEREKLDLLRKLPKLFNKNL